MLNGYAVNEHRIRAIENKMDDLVESNKLLKEDVDGIKNLLLKLIERPITIHNNIQLGSQKLEDKIIETLNEIIKSSKNTGLNNQLEEVKQDIQGIPEDPKAKNRIKRFFKDIGDEKSDTNKAIKGAGIAKNMVTELVKLLRDLVT